MFLIHPQGRSHNTPASHVCTVPVTPPWSMPWWPRGFGFCGGASDQLQHRFFWSSGCSSRCTIPQPTSSSQNPPKIRGRTHPGCIKRFIPHHRSYCCVRACWHGSPPSVYALKLTSPVSCPIRLRRSDRQVVDRYGAEPSGSFRLYRPHLRVVRAGPGKSKSSAESEPGMDRRIITGAPNAHNTPWIRHNIGLGFRGHCHRHFYCDIAIMTSNVRVHVRLGSGLHHWPSAQWLLEHRHPTVAAMDGTYRTRPDRGLPSGSVPRGR